MIKPFKKEDKKETVIQVIKVADMTLPEVDFRATNNLLQKLVDKKEEPIDLEVILEII